MRWESALISYRYFEKEKVMRNKGKSLLVLLMSMLMVIGAFGVVSFAADASAHTTWSKTGSSSDWDTVYVCDQGSHSIAWKWEDKKASYTYGDTIAIKALGQYYCNDPESSKQEYIPLRYSNDGGNTWTTTVPQNVGNYLVALRGDKLAEIFSDDTLKTGVNDTLEFEIKKADPKVTTPGSKTLKYNGEDQALVKAGTTDVGTMKYQYRVAETGEWSDWSEDVPVAKNAATYEINWKVVLSEAEEKNYNNVAPGTVVTSEIKKIDPDYTAPTPKENLVSDGETELALVNKGTTEEGTTMYYSLSEDSGYSTAVPTDIGPGEYNVWYYVKGDANHNDTEPAKVEVTVYKGIITNEDITWPVAWNRIYTGALAFLNKGGLVADGKGHFEYTGEGVTISDKGRPQATDVGTYEITATVVPEDGYILADDVEEEATFSPTISPAKLGIIWDACGGTEEEGVFIYNVDGSLQGPEANLTGVKDADADAVTVKYNDTNKKTEAGIYTAEATLNGDKAGNYEFDEAAATTQQFKIVGENIVPTINIDNFVYGAEPDPVAEAGDIDLTDPRYTVELQWRLGRNGDKSEWTSVEDFKTAFSTKDANPAPADIYYAWLKITDNEGVYTFNRDDGGKAVTNFRITKRPVELTVSPTEKYYGEDDPEFTYSSDSDLPKDVELTDILVGEVARDEGEAVDTYAFTSPSLSNDATKNYTLAFSNEFEIKQATTNRVTVDISGWTYDGKSAGSEDHPVTVTADYGEDTATLTYQKQGSSEWTEKAPKDAGVYTVKATIAEIADYAGGEATDTFIIHRADAKIKAKSLSVVYNGTVREPKNNSTWVEVSGTVGSEKLAFELKSDPATIQDAGEYTVYAVPDDTAAVNKNYKIKLESGTVTVTPAKMNVIKEDYCKNYDAQRHSSEKEEIGVFVENWKHEAIEDDQYTIYYSKEELNEENYKFKGQTTPIEFKDAVAETRVYFYIETSNYAPTEQAGFYTVEIKKVPLKISGKTVPATYGTLVSFEDSETYVKYEGFVGGETKDVLDGSLKFTYGGYNQFSDVGTYPVTLDGLTSNNYKITYADGSIKVEPKPVTVTWSHDGSFADDYTVTYDGKRHRIDADVVYGAEDADDNKVYSRDEDDVWADVSGYYATDVKRNDDWAVVPYTATATLTSGKAAANYTLVGDTTHTFTINPAAATLTPKAASCTYGDDPASISYNGYDGTGFVNGEDVSVVKEGAKPGYTTTYKQYGDVGSYDISFNEATRTALNTKDGLYAQNYDLGVATGTNKLTVNKATLTVTAKDQTINYGADYNHSLYSVTGFKGGDTEAVLTAKPVLSSDYFVNAKADTYTLKVDGAEAKNYTFTYVDGTLKVNDVVNTLVAQAKTSGSTAVKASWNKVTNAASYDVYLAKCNTKKRSYVPKLKGTTSGNSLKIKKLKKGTCYKFYVVAKDANGNVISKSATGHVIAGNVSGTKTNAKSIKASKSTVALNKGGTYKLKATQKKAKSGKKYKLLNGGHAALTRYISSNKAVATVGSNGVITAVGGGYCKVYAIAVNGMWSEVEVYVN